MSNYRLRAEGELLVLQVREDADPYSSYSQHPKWRDAKLTDIPVADVFGPREVVVCRNPYETDYPGP